MEKLTGGKMENDRLLVLSRAVEVEGILGFAEGLANIADMARTRHMFGLDVIAHTLPS